MLILKPYIFNEFPEIIFGFSTKLGPGTGPPYYFNLSQSVDDDRDKVNYNREVFFNSIGLTREKAAFQKQVHGDTITYVSVPGNVGESDAMVTDKREVALSISTADCTAIFIYDPVKKIIAGIHSGWRGTEKRITAKTLQRLKTEYGCRAENLFVYVGPSISRDNYEVGREVADRFNSRYVDEKNGKIYLDVSAANYDMIINAEVPYHQIQKSPLCSFEYKELLHSFRRDGKRSGRSLGVIAFKGHNE